MTIQLLVLCGALVVAFPARSAVDPNAELAEADRLAWLKNWTKAEPHFAQAEKAYGAMDDRRNALYARVGRLRGEIAVFTEGRGANRLQGRIVLLVNEHSASASEMVAAFAATEGRLKIVGARTAGRVVGANSFKVGGGFRVTLPVAAYRTWDGTVLEGIGVAPTINVDFAPQATSDGR